ncbi:hypothetical protein T552_02263 [Pneumocystis carinii B80]|uniref:RAD50-interacting protein 1 n=1 Tax=Pneumocystis carinii (strain B80) TaxID=1408658 RepID=A0A0W4ZFX6_PNEC8|nr:hypothetical protein T552_02263 [Pneumocystis carinii B80]KTW27280.1 hypothetical protein T552_02263 [Pneumocystis carinii B80]
MNHPYIPGSWIETPTQRSRINMFQGETSCMKPYDTVETHYLEKINEYLKKPEDVKEIDSYIESLERELNVLKLQEKKETDELIYIKDKVNQNTEKVKIYSEIVKKCLKNTLEPFLWESEEEKIFFEELYTIIKYLKSLQVSKTYLLILMQVERLSCLIKESIETDKKTALISYHQLIQLNYNLKESNKNSDKPLVHLEMFIQERLHSSWDIIEIKLCKEFHDHFEEIGWPNKIKKGISPSDESFKRFQSSFQTLLIQHREIVKSLENKDENPECTKTDNLDVLFPFLIMVRPLNIQFRYHFMEKRKTDRIDKPEWFYTYILDIISSCADFFCIKIQNIINETPERDRNSLNEFITALLKIVEEKIQTSIKYLLMNVHIFSHFVYETIKFDNILQQDFGYFPYKGQWNGMIHIALGDPKNFMTWLESEKKFSIEQFQNIIDVNISPNTWDLDYDSVGESETKPTNSSLRIKCLIESITEQYRPLKDFNQKSMFFTEIQCYILNSYYERLKSAADAFDVTFSRIIQAVSGNKTDKMIQDVKGLETLCRVYGSCIFIESCLSDWDDDIFFLELWQNLTTENKTIYEANTNSENSNSLLEIGQGSLFSKISLLYFNLHERTEKLIIRHLEREIKEKLQPYFKIYTWSSSENPSSSIAMSSPVSMQMVDALKLVDSMLNFLKRAVSHLTFLRIYRRFSLTVENLLWKKIILKKDFSERGGIQFTRDVWEFWATCSKYVERPEQNMKKIEDATILLSLNASNEDDKKSISTVASIIFDTYKSFEEKKQYLKMIGLKHINTAEARDILQRRIDCWAQ